MPLVLSLWQPDKCFQYTEQDIVRAFTLEETKELVKMILSMEV